MKPLIIAINVLITQIGPGFESSVRFRSLESKTSHGNPVFNEIKFISNKNQDVWMMNQSHFGPSASEGQLDRLAIVIDKTSSPYSARFLQLTPGPLVWEEDLEQKRVSFKVSCFVCHANGLRTIRADWSGELNKRWTDQLKINYLNQMMNAYRLVLENKIHSREDIVANPPFRFRGQIENETLTLKACTQCHDGEKRSKLTRQNGLAIQFLVAQKLMPPDGVSLSPEELKKIENFTNGF